MDSCILCGNCLPIPVLPGCVLCEDCSTYFNTGREPIVWFKPIPAGWRVALRRYPEAAFEFTSAELADVRDGVLRRYRDWMRRTLTHVGMVPAEMTDYDPLSPLREAMGSLA